MHVRATDTPASNASAQICVVPAGSGLTNVPHSPLTTQVSYALGSPGIVTTTVVARFAVPPTRTLTSSPVDPATGEVMMTDALVGGAAAVAVPAEPRMTSAATSATRMRRTDTTPTIKTPRKDGAEPGPS